MDAFLPKIKKPFAKTLVELEEAEKKRQELERQLYLCRNSRRFRGQKSVSPERLEKELAALREQTEEMLKEVEHQTECLKKGRRHYFSPDEQMQPYNECIGDAYGVAVFLRDDGTMLCCEQSHDLTFVGDTVSEDDLFPLDRLPEDEQDLILQALMESPDTPDFFKQIQNTKKENTHD